MSSTAARGSSPCLVVFDLDGVLTTRDTLTALIGRALCRRPWRLAWLLKALISFARHHRDVPRRQVAVARIVSVLFTDVGPDEMDRWCAELGRRAATSRRWARPTLMAEFRRLQALGHPMVVATATEQRVAAALLDQAGLHADAVLGSHIVSGVGPATARLSVYNYGPEKCRSLEQSGVELAEAVFYTDSSSDLWTALATRRSVLVHPSRSTAAAFAEAGIVASTFPCVEARLDE